MTAGNGILLYAVILTHVRISNRRLYALHQPRYEKTNPVFWFNVWRIACGLMLPEGVEIPEQVRYDDMVSILYLCRQRDTGASPV